MPQKLPDKLLRWLYQVLQPEYHNPVLCYQDVSLVLMCFPYFRVRTSVYTMQHGENRLMVKLYGPVDLQAGNNITSLSSNEHLSPSCVDFTIWIPFEYPEAPPIVYVKNSDDRQKRGDKASSEYTIIPNNYCDPSGRFYHPFLSNWTRQFGSDTSNSTIKPQNNRLLLLTQLLLRCLKEHPPFLHLVAPSPITSSNSSSSTNNAPPLPQKPSNGHKPQAKNSAEIVDSVVAPKFAKIKLMDDQVQLSKSHNSKGPPPLLPANPNTAQLVENIRKTLNEKIQAELLEEIPLKEIIQMQNDLLSVTESDINAASYLTYYEAKIVQRKRLLSSKLEEMKDLHKKLDADIEQVLPKFDECLIAETPVFNQLYTLVTKSEAMTDLLYHLEKLHAGGKIKFDKYLQVARRLAREQCLCKQHINKLSDICGLDQG